MPFHKTIVGLHLLWNRFRCVEPRHAASLHCVRAKTPGGAAIAGRLLEEEGFGQAAVRIGVVRWATSFPRGRLAISGKINEHASTMAIT